MGQLMRGNEILEKSTRATVNHTHQGTMKDEW
jgi:hypothetical protein